MEKSLNFNTGRDIAAESPTGNPSGDEDLQEVNVIYEVYETEFVGSRSMNVRFGDYKFIFNTLNKRFGSSCASIIKKNIWDEEETFGAVCDYYDKNESCNRSTAMTPLVLTSTMRSGRVIKTCEEIAMKDSCIEYFLSTANLNIDSEYNKENLLKAYQVFFPIEDKIDNTLEAALLNLGDQFEDSFEKWKAMSLAMCIAPKWQIP
jgi:hypothetical protein